MRIHDGNSGEPGAEDFREPTEAELAAIDREMPLIEAEVRLLDAEIRLISAVDGGYPSPLDWRRVRRAEAQLARVAADLFARPAASLPRFGAMGGAA